VTHLARFEYAGTDTDHVINYVLSGLPTERPITVDCATTPAAHWSGDGTKIPMVERFGWAGAITIHPATIAERLRSGRFQHAGIGTEVELNPQPIPPGRTVSTIERANPERVALNPQPIPPGRLIAAEAGAKGAMEQEAPAKAATAVQMLGKQLDPERHATAMVERDNPSGSGEVDGIDFTVQLVDKPR